MNIFLYKICVFIYVAVTLSWCQYETIKCKIKSGFHITACENYDTVEAPEFPLTCQQMSVGSLLSIVSGNRRQINSLRKDMHNVKSKNTFQSEKLNELEGQVENLKQANEDLKSEMDLMNRKVNSMYAEILRLSREGNNSGKKTPPGAIKQDDSFIKAGNCDVVIGGNCYLIFIRNTLDLTFSEAVAICNDHKSSVALFPNNDTYDKIVKYLRTQLPVGWLNILVWTGLEIDAKTGNAKNELTSFAIWKPDALHTGPSHLDYTNVYLEVSQLPTHSDQGMGNFLPSSPMHGVVCQRTS
ncbi:uncharacterized protein LOC120346018 isoform X1 [Styela clava]